MISLVGSTGFVGGNLAEHGSFDGLYHSTNIQEAFGTKPDILVYAGLRAEKFLAEKDPETDLKSILTAQENIRKIGPGKLVLISTVDVYEKPDHATENTEASGQGAYGKHRAQMEAWVQSEYPDHLIIRLPGLFGKGIKKNFIYDYIHYVPSLISAEKMSELILQAPELYNWYRLNDRGFYQFMKRSEGDEKALRARFEEIGFSALNFTDSRGIFQYYDLSHLFDDISAALAHNRKVLNLATEPVSVHEIYKHLTGGDFQNKLPKDPPRYDFRTLYYEDFGGHAAKDAQGGYLYSKKQILKEIKSFTEREMQI